MTYHIYTTTRLGLAGARRSEALRAPRHLGGAGAACRDRVPREVRRRQAAASRVQGAERGPVMPTKGEPIGWTPKKRGGSFLLLAHLRLAVRYARSRRSVRPSSRAGSRVQREAHVSLRWRT